MTLNYLLFDASDDGADTGTWELHDRNERRRVLSLHGRVGVRRFALIHTGGTQWLLHLTKEQGHG